MSNGQKSCPQHFSIWVAFIMGMVIVVIAVVIFDRVVGGGRLSAEGKGGGGSVGTSQAPETVGQGNPGADTPRLPDTINAVQPITYLAAKGEVDGCRAWLGLEAADVTEAMTKQLELDFSGGVLVSKVIDGGPAAEAGIERGDIIYEFDRRKVGSLDRLAELLSKNEPDDRVRVVLSRDRSREVVYVRLGTSPTSTSPDSATTPRLAPANLSWGMAVSELTATLRKAYAIPEEEKGALVVLVVPGSAAARADLRVGDLIQQANGSSVGDLADLFGALRSAGTDTLLEVYRAGSQVHVQVAGASPLAPVAGPVPSARAQDPEASPQAPSAAMARQVPSAGMSAQGPPAEIPPSGMGMPAQVPPAGVPRQSPSSGMPQASVPSPTLRMPVPQQGIGMNRPAYVPGYDQTQSGEPRDKTTTRSSPPASTVAGDSDKSGDPPVCKRIEGIEEAL